MKKIMILILIDFPLWGFSQNTKGLTLIFEGDDFTVYMDTDVKKQMDSKYQTNYVRIVHDSNYARNYKSALAKELKNEKLLKMKYNRQTVLVDIKNKRVKTLQVTYFNSDNIPIDSRKYNSWDYISPNTFSDIVYRSTKDVIENYGL